MLIPLKLAKPGTRLVKAVFRDGRPLVPKGVTLSSATLERLRERGVTDISIEDDRAADIAEYTSISPETRAQGAEILRAFCAAVQAGPYVVPTEDCAALVREIVADLGDGRAERSLRLLQSDEPGDYMVVHALNTATICAAVAHRRREKERTVINAGVAGLLHDIGLMVDVPPAQMQATLADRESPVLRAHPKRGFEILQQSGNLSPFVKAAIAQHHERLDGSGFPNGLSGERIRPLGALVALAELCGEVVDGFGPTGRLLPAQAIEFIMSLAGSAFDAALVRDVLRVVVPYPVGSWVKLDSGEIGIVVSVPRSLPTCPLVRVLVGADGAQLTAGRDVDFAAHANRTLMIAEVLGG